MSTVTDFFDTHRAQCVRYASKLRGVAGAESLVAKMDDAVAACDAAIAAGRRRVDMPAVVAEMPTIVTRYEALPQKTKSDFHESLKGAAVDTQSTEGKT